MFRLASFLLCALLASAAAGVTVFVPGCGERPPLPPDVEVDGGLVEGDGGVSDPDGGTTGGEGDGGDDAGMDAPDGGGGDGDAGTPDGSVDGGDTGDAGPTWPAPDAVLLTAPLGLVDTTEATFTFKANDPRHTFQCSLDYDAFLPCTSPTMYSGLSEGTHWFSVRAVAPDGAVDFTPATRGWRIDTAPPGPRTLRFMAANLTSGNGQDYDLGHGIRIFQGLRPDVVLIQEFNYGGNAPVDIRDFVAEAFGSEFFYARQQGVQISNGIISRYPIIDSGIWDDPETANREFNWARIDLPGTVDLWAVSVHLLTTSASVRNSEAAALVAAIQANVPSGDYLVVGGDFNTNSRTESAISTLSQVVVTSNSVVPWPVDQSGDGDTNANRTAPYDWLLPDADLAAKEVPLKIGMQSFTYGLVFDSRVFTPLADVSPVEQGDSAAPNMQHMAVLKDFVFP